MLHSTSLKVITESVTITQVLLLLHLAPLDVITENVTISVFGVTESDRLRELLFLYLVSMKLKWQSHIVYMLS